MKEKRCRCLAQSIETVPVRRSFGISSMRPSIPFDSHWLIRALAQVCSKRTWTASLSTLALPLLVAHVSAIIFAERFVVRPALRMASGWCANRPANRPCNSNFPW